MLHFELTIIIGAKFWSVALFWLQKVCLQASKQLNLHIYVLGYSPNCWIEPLLSQGFLYNINPFTSPTDIYVIKKRN